MILLFCPLLSILIFNSQFLAHLVLIYLHLLQVLLHDPAEEPQMKDLAFAVSPGSQTLAAIKHTKVSLREDWLLKTWEKYKNLDLS